MFAFNYSALISCGISASALSGLKFSIPKLVAAVAEQLFTDNRTDILTTFFDYDQVEFTEEWPRKEQRTDSTPRIVHTLDTQLVHLIWIAHLIFSNKWLAGTSKAASLLSSWRKSQRLHPLFISFNTRFPPCCTMKVTLTFHLLSLHHLNTGGSHGFSRD